METKETTTQRRERLAREIDWPAFDLGEVVELRDGRQARALAAAARIIKSDRAAGCDPGVLLEEIERGRAARQEISAIAKAINWRYDGSHQKSLVARVVAVIEREEQLEAERDELAARLAVATEVLGKIATEDLEIDCLERADVFIRETARDALANLPARTEAMLRLVEAARNASLTGEGVAELRDVLCVLDGEVK